MVYCLRIATAVLVAALGIGAVPGHAAPFVYVTNFNSRDLSQYDAAGGALTPLSPPTVPLGDFPLGVAVSPDGKNVYVTTFHPSVLQFAVAANGTLTLRSSAPVPPTALPGQLAVSPDGGNVYVIGHGGAGTVLQYSVASDGSLVPKSPPTVASGSGPTRLAISPDGQSVYVTSASGTVFGLSAIFQYTVGADGTLSPKSPPSVEVDSDPFISLVGVAVNPDGGSVYVVNSAALLGTSGAVLQYDVAADGTLTPKSPPSVLAGADPFEIVVAPDGESAYATDSAELGTVLQFTVGADGSLSPNSPEAVAAGTFPLGIAISGDGTSVYAANAGDNSISQYDVSVDDTLAPRSPAAVATGGNPIEIAVSPPPRVPTSKDQCKNGRYRQFGFKNQGQCVAFVERGARQ
jgi:DNA-binding beta-propeller fold protein YncE